MLNYSHTGTADHKLSYWLCQCDCGTVKAIPGTNLIPGEGRTKSCGCLVIEHISRVNYINGRSNKTHPQRYLLQAWNSIIQRCYSPTYRHYKGWGGRGIQIAPQWRHDSHRFIEDVLAEIGERPTLGHSLDRKNNDGHYEPDNIRWATDAEQNRNKRTTRMITAGNRTQCLTDWAKELHRSPRTISARIDELGWSEEEAVEVVQRTKPTR